MGFATIGHAVWIFDGSSLAMLAAGCREADLVIVDSAFLEKLPASWRSLDHCSLIIYTMMTSSILYFQRNTTGAALSSSKY
jgi:hypothetical protein